jgi:hypothetical protein
MFDSPGQKPIGHECRLVRYRGKGATTPATPRRSGPFAFPSPLASCARSQKRDALDPNGRDLCLLGLSKETRQALIREGGHFFVGDTCSRGTFIDRSFIGDIQTQALCSRLVTLARISRRHFSVSEATGECDDDEGAMRATHKIKLGEKQKNITLSNIVANEEHLECIQDLRKICSSGHIFLRAFYKYTWSGK